MSLMKTGDTIDILMHHEIKEMGKHMSVYAIFGLLKQFSNI
jgi:hypothetical protein